MTRETVEELAAAGFILGLMAAMIGIVMVAVGQQGVDERSDYVGLAVFAAGCLLSLVSYAVLLKRKPRSRV